MDAAYLSALHAPGGALIGELTALGTSWLTQQEQFHNALRQAERTQSLRRSSTTSSTSLHAFSATPCPTGRKTSRVWQRQTQQEG
jgi:hypothetical protein